MSDTTRGTKRETGKRALAHLAAPATLALALTLGVTSPAAATILTFEIFYDSLPCSPCFEDNHPVDPADPAPPAPVKPFLPDGYGYPEGFRLSDDYGDNVAGPINSGLGVVPPFFETADPNPPSGTNGIFRYGEGGEGFTPNVTAHYGPYSFLTGGPELWREGYGDLDGVLRQGSRHVNPSNPVGNDYNVLDVVLVAEPGWDVVLHDFDVAGWFDKDVRKVTSVALFGGVPAPFLTPNNYLDPPSANPFGDVDVPGTGHLSYSTPLPFDGTPLTSHVIWLRIDASNLGPDSENIAIDNIRFGQVASITDPDGLEPPFDPALIDEAFQSSEVVATPEPASLVLMLVGGAGAALERVRRRRRNG